MSNGYICVFDSGIGGISVLTELQKLLPNERYIYVGDNKNTPYGNKSKRKLLDLTLKALSCAMKYPLKAIVLGCNTLSLTIREELGEILGVPIFGVFPPVETQILVGAPSLLLCTSNTAKMVNKGSNLVVCSCDNLAPLIESNCFNLDMINLSQVLNNKILTTNDFNCVILGCTHYVLIQNKIFNHLKPQIITSGNHQTAKALYNFLKNTKSLDNYKRNEVLFLGENAQKNKNMYFWVVKKVQFI